ncbi:hypothetical protein GIB67_012774 [Kingdonia uniflora]|uniref:Uncharacterized protein n=1 Tax=Kingdonia uniflora TaxID=39325 RepID=A0A7J7NFE4_9MAGN|nr:hypothetical protein GIB67_012774 [Kingdonia uniflora]
MTLITEDIKAKAEIFYGAEICGEKAKELLAEMKLPNGLLPVDSIDECGYVRESGFFWFKRQMKKEFKFKSTGKLISYAREVSGYAETNKIKKLSGVKSKELSLWISVHEINVHDPPNGKITFKASAGLTKTFSVSAFEISDGELGEEVKDLDEQDVEEEDLEQEVKAEELKHEVQVNEVKA